MGIKSSVKIQYWQNGVEAINYGENNKIISEANIEPDIGSPIFESIEAAYNAASLGFNLASGNFVSAGLNGLQLAASINDLRDALADKTASDSAALQIPYPHPLFNSIHLIFEAESTFDGVGDRDSLGEARYFPPASAHSPIIRLYDTVTARNEDNRPICRKAEYVINLDQLRHNLGEEAFFSSGTNPKPFVFEFAVKEDHVTTTTAAVLHMITLYFTEQEEMPPSVTTDILYCIGPTPENDTGMIVEQQRLMQYTVGDTSPESGENIVLVDMGFAAERDGRFRVNGKAYDYLSLQFRVSSLRKYNAERPPLEITGDAHPNDAKGVLKPVVHQPVRARVQNAAGHYYEPEGVGTAYLIISPGDIPLGKRYSIIFSASQQPGGWVAMQTVRLARYLTMDPAEHPREDPRRPEE